MEKYSALDMALVAKDLRMRLYRGSSLSTHLSKESARALLELEKIRGGSIFKRSTFYGGPCFLYSVLNINPHGITLKRNQARK